MKSVKSLAKDYLEYFRKGDSNIVVEAFVGIAGWYSITEWGFSGFIIVFTAMEIAGFIIDRKGWDNPEQNPLKNGAEKIA